MTWTADDLRLEVAPGADLTRPAASWPWVDITDRVEQQSVTIRRGAGAEASGLNPAQVSLAIDNRDGLLTPGDPRSPWYGRWGRGTPARLGIGAGDRALRLPGDPGDAAVASTSLPEVESLLRVEWEGETAWDPSVTSVLVGGWASPSDPGSWAMVAIPDGRVAIWWVTDTGALRSTSAMRLPPVVGRVAVAVELELVPEGFRQRLYVAAAGLDGPWELVSQMASATASSLPAGGEPITLGLADPSPAGTVASPAAGLCWRARVVADGVEIVAPDMRGLDPAQTSWTDDLGASWSVTGGAEVVVTPAHVRLLGTIDDVTQTWPAGDNSVPALDEPADSAVEVTIAGPARRLKRAPRPLESALRRRVLGWRWGGDLIAYWPLEDDRDAATAASPLPGVQPLIIGGEFRFAADSSNPASLPLPQVGQGQPGGWSAVVPPAADGRWVVEWMCRIPEMPTVAPFSLMVVRTSGNPSTWALDLLPSSALRVSAFDRDGQGGPVVVMGVDADEMTTWWQYLRLELQQVAPQTATLHLTVVPLNRSGLAGGVSVPAPASTTVGHVTAVQNLFSAAPPGGFTVGHIIVQRGRGLGWLAQAETAHIGELAHERFARLCREEGLPVEIVGRSEVTMGPQSPAKLIDLLSECVEADGGRMFELPGELGLGFRTRLSLYNQEPKLVLDASTRLEGGAIVSDVTNPIAPTWDDRAVVNDVTAKRREGSSARVTTDPPPDPAALYDIEVELNVERDEGLEQQASHRLTLGTWQGPRVPAVSTDLTVAPHLVDEWLRLREGDRVRVVGLPSQAPLEGVDVLVEGIADEMRGARWVGELNASPAGPWQVGVLDGPAPTAELDRLDSDRSTLATWPGIDEDATEFDVLVEDGPLWTTDPVFFPLEVEVDGEVMRVLSITGASSLQTFTVERAQNGVAKSHAAGTPVRVHRPFRLRL